MQIIRIILPSFFIFYFLFSILAFSTYAQEKDLTINADNVSYDKEKNLVEAEGSVEVIYKDVTVHGNHIVYNTQNERVYADRGFDLNYEGITIEGESLDYGIKNKEGKATKVKFTYQKIRLAGGKIEIGIDKFHLRDASFTTCDLEEGLQHYRVTASEIILYPKYGWLVAYWGWFWLGRFPIVPMPTYIYDLFAEEKARRNIPPFPEISSNDEDGAYINERLAWHVRRELSGTYSINYATKKGLGGGAEADYIVTENSRGNVRLYGNFTDGVWGGITHRLFFGGEIKEEVKLPVAFFALPRPQQFELETTLSARERINYERVSFYPNLALKMQKSELFRKELKYDTELILGMVGEEKNISLARGGGRLGVYWSLPEIVLGSITPSVSLDTRFYSNGGRWTRTTGGIGLRKTFTENLSLALGYLHYFSVDGQSPFNFEMYRFSSSDRLTSDLSFMLGETGIGISTSYFVPTWQPEDIDYSLFFGLRCYNLMVKYRSLRREFELGFSLVGG